MRGLYLLMSISVPDLKHVYFTVAELFEIEKVQKRATKLIMNFKNMSYTDRLQRLNLPTLKYKRLRGDMIEVF